MTMSRAKVSWHLTQGTMIFESTAKVLAGCKLQVLQNLRLQGLFARPWEHVSVKTDMHAVFSAKAPKAMMRGWPALHSAPPDSSLFLMQAPRLWQGRTQPHQWGCDGQVGTGWMLGALL